MRMRNPEPSLPDTRQVVVTNHSVVIDGRDITHMVTEVEMRVRPDSWPLVLITAAPDEILYSGSAVVPEVPLDGIARLRKRLGQ